MAKKKDLSILFIENSHTYYNDMPRLVKLRAIEEGFNCRVMMLAHPNWFLSQHAEEPEARFNILHGKYDYVVLIFLARLAIHYRFLVNASLFDSNQLSGNRL